MFTAIVQTREPAALSLPGVAVLNTVQTVRRPSDMLCARLDALARVETDFCFYLDGGDALPDDYLDVLAECAAADAPLAYTDETVNGMRRRAAPYDAAVHAANPMLVHHLALMRTADARAAAATLPAGDYLAEPLLFFKLARRGGAAYVPRVGYHWNRGEAGLSRQADTMIAQMASATLCAKGGAWLA